jgi:hypothetical protein
VCTDVGLQIISRISYASEKLICEEEITITTRLRYKIRIRTRRVGTKSEPILGDTLAARGLDEHV